MSRRPLREFADLHSDAGRPLGSWCRIAKAAVWRSIEDVRATYPHADFTGGLTIFNVKGNAYRLVVSIDYSGQRIFVRSVMTHAEYDRGDWR